MRYFPLFPHSLHGHLLNSSHLMAILIEVMVILMVEMERDSQPNIRLYSYFSMILHGKSCLDSQSKSLLFEKSPVPIEAKKKNEDKKVAFYSKRKHKRT